MKQLPLLLMLSAISGCTDSSPSSIAYIAIMGGDPEICIVHATESSGIPLTANENYEGHPSLSPDGKRIVFESRRQGDRVTQLYIMDSDGTNVRRMTQHSPGGAWHPSWSPDGKAVAFCSNKGGGIEPDLWLIEMDGTERRIFQSEGPEEEPSWSPDGNSLVFSSRRDGNWGLFTVSVDGSNSRRLTRDFDFNPAWSPDGKRIAFTRRGQRTTGIYIAQADGTNQLFLTDGEDPSWSPTGEYIAFVYEGALYRMRSDGSAKERLAVSSYQTKEPSWSP